MSIRMSCIDMDTACQDGDWAKIGGKIVKNGPGKYCYRNLPNIDSKSITTLI